MVFNMGVATLRKKFPSFCKAVKDKDYLRASLEMTYNNGLKPESGFCDYYLQTKSRAKRLIERMQKLV